jgi:hypothetical protein
MIGMHEAARLVGDWTPIALSANMNACPTCPASKLPASFPTNRQQASTLRHQLPP